LSVALASVSIVARGSTISVKCNSSNTYGMFFQIATVVNSFFLFEGVNFRSESGKAAFLSRYAHAPLTSTSIIVRNTNLTIGNASTANASIIQTDTNSGGVISSCVILFENVMAVVRSPNPGYAAGLRFHARAL